MIQRRHMWPVLGLIAVTLCCGQVLSVENDTVRAFSATDLDIGADLPADLIAPEGKSRWRLESLRSSPAPDQNAPPSLVTFSDPTGGSDALAWVSPEKFRDRLQPGYRDSLVLDRHRNGVAERLLVEVETVGIGWVHLPSGAREVALQRARVVSPGGSELIYRWVDPRVGVIAEVQGTGSGGLVAMESVTGGSMVEGMIDAAADLKIYSSQVDFPVAGPILYGWDKGGGTLVSSLTPEAYTTIGDLIAANSWDFSQTTSGTVVAQSEMPVSSAETCNSTLCGYDVTGGILTRQDHAFDSVDVVINNQVRETTEDASGVKMWLRAGRQKEGVTGGFGTGETGFCFTTDGSETRTPVRLWDFANLDANGWFIQAGDSWSDGPFVCEQNVVNYSNGCGSGSWPFNLYTKACSGFSGTQSGEVLKGGVVTLPSGHTLNALLTRTVAEYCVYVGSSCLFATDDVRTAVYLWQVPDLGAVVLLQSDQSVPDITTFMTLQNTNITFGLFPPLSINASGPTGTTVDLSWDPGNNTTYIDDYKIYWDTDSGSSSAYAFNSVDDAVQVSMVGTTATISGLESGTQYFFTVTSLSDYESPVSGTVVTHESLLYPTQVSGDPDHVYPVEVMAQTGGGSCIPTAEVSNLVLGKSAGNIQFCWDAVTDPCLAGYDVLGSDTSDLAAGFTVIGGVTAAETCWTGNPTQNNFIVVARGTGGSGPMGHYGQ